MMDLGLKQALMERIPWAQTAKGVPEAASLETITDSLGYRSAGVEEVSPAAADLPAQLAELVAEGLIVVADGGYRRKASKPKR